MSGINAEYLDSESPDPLMGVLVRDKPDDEDEEEDEGDGKEDGDDDEDDDGYSE
jgi:hypothetical protein